MHGQTKSLQNKTSGCRSCIVESSRQNVFRSKSVLGFLSEGSEVRGERVRERRVAGSTRDEAKTSKRSFPPELPLDATSARELIADGPLHRVDAVPLVQRPGRTLPGGEPRLVPARPYCSGSGSFPTSISVFRIPIYGIPEHTNT